MQEGAGQLVYTPEQPGRLYLYDANNAAIVEAFQVRKGQRFAVDAAPGRATLEGNEVSVGKLSIRLAVRKAGAARHADGPHEATWPASVEWQELNTGERIPLTQSNREPQQIEIGPMNKAHGIAGIVSMLVVAATGCSA